MKKSKFEPKIMVWGAISVHGKSKLHFVTGSMNSEQYAGVIDHVLVPFIRKYHDQDVIFQQDNAPCHVSKASREHFSKKNIQIMEWPANSPDLNPIEKMFSKLKALLKKAAKRTIGELWNEIGKLLDTFSPTECANYFKAAGYVSA